MLRPLSAAEVAQAPPALGRDADDPELHEAAAQAEGSIGRALALLEGPALALRQQVSRCSSASRRRSARAACARRCARRHRAAAARSFVDTVNEWLAARTANGPPENRRLVRLAEAWDKINQAARDADIYNLDRKPLVFAVFGWLAEAARR